MSRNSEHVCKGTVDFQEFKLRFGSDHRDHRAYLSFCQYYNIFKAIINIKYLNKIIWEIILKTSNKIESNRIKTKLKRDL